MNIIKYYSSKTVSIQPFKYLTVIGLINRYFKHFSTTYQIHDLCSKSIFDQRRGKYYTH